MREYQKKIKSNGGREPLAQDASTGATRRPHWMNLAAQLGVEDEDMVIGDSSQGEQTVEQEYQAYVTAQPSKSDILKFWEVGGRFNGA